MFFPGPYKDTSSSPRALVHANMLTTPMSNLLLYPSRGALCSPQAQLSKHPCLKSLKHSLTTIIRACLPALPSCRQTRPMGADAAAPAPTVDTLVSNPVSAEETWLEQKKGHPSCSRYHPYHRIATPPARLPARRGNRSQEREIKLQLTWKRLPSWLAFMALEGAMETH